MIGELVQHRVRVRPVGPQGGLAYGGYMYLVYDVTEPLEVRLADSSGGDGELVFPRDLLAAALGGDPAEAGQVQVRLRHFRGVRHCMLMITVTADDGSQAWALGDDAAAEFLQATIDLVPLGEEWRFLNLDAVVAGLLEEAP
jgi:hypothetical protein